MHVVPKKTIVDKLLAEIRNLRAQGREPDYVVLNPDEYRDLREDARVASMLHRPYDFFGSLKGSPAEAPKLNVREFRLRRTEYASGAQGRAPVIKAISQEKFNGLDLFVVPPEYEPY